MSLWIKILIGLWLYLSMGFGIVLLIQIIAKKAEDWEVDDLLTVCMRLYPDDYDFVANVIGMTILWPFLLLYLCYILLEEALKKLFRKLWEKLDEEKKGGLNDRLCHY